MKARLTTRAAAVLLFLPALAQAGLRTGADFLTIPASARFVALAETDTALASGASAIGSNPAGMSIVDAEFSSWRRAPAEVLLSRQALSVGRDYHHANLVIPTKTLTLGFDVSSLTYPAQQVRRSDQSMGGSFRAQDLAMGVGVGLRVGRAHYGALLKRIAQDLSSSRAEGYAFDGGAILPVEGTRFTIGAAVRNLGPRLRFESKKFHLPLTLSAGAGYRWKDRSVFGLDVRSEPYGRRTSLGLGVELTAATNLVLRGGYQVRSSQGTSATAWTDDSLRGLTAGMGLRLGVLTLDYGVAAFGETGNNHVFTLSSTFGGRPPLDAAASPAPTDKKDNTAAPTSLDVDQSKDWWK